MKLKEQWDWKEDYERDKDYPMKTRRRYLFEELFCFLIYCDTYPSHPQSLWFAEMIFTFSSTVFM
jgi:hypothetical protein